MRKGHLSWLIGRFLAQAINPYIYSVSYTIMYCQKHIYHIQSETIKYCLHYQIVPKSNKYYERVLDSVRQCKILPDMFFYLSGSVRNQPIVLYITLIVLDIFRQFQIMELHDKSLNNVSHSNTRCLLLLDSVKYCQIIKKKCHILADSIKYF